MQQVKAESRYSYFSYVCLFNDAVNSSYSTASKCGKITEYFIGKNMEEAVVALLEVLLHHLPGEESRERQVRYIYVHLKVLSTLSL
jgi:hypothetical protein